MTMLRIPPPNPNGSDGNKEGVNFFFAKVTYCNTIMKNEPNLPLLS
jgi:hypothetical protein